MFNNLFNCKLQLLALKTFNSKYSLCVKQPSIYFRRHFNFAPKFLISSNANNRLQSRIFLNNLLQIGRKSGKSLRLFSFSLGIFYPISRVAQCRQHQSTRIDHSHQQRSIAPLSVTWTEFWLLIRPYIHWLICAALTACCVAALNIQIPIILGQLVNQIYSFIKQNGVDVNLGELKPIVFKLVSVYVAQAFTTFLCIASLSQMGERMCADLRVRLFSHLLELPMPFFDAQNSGELSDRLNFDVQQFKSSFKECTAQGLRTTAQVFILNI
ncbi:unnamed protein product [Meloidogyne enterolobii]|uniref:Uncharacterized protein n=1 Tax=Meloidogyne enterolobii TaxID=390850 RepID=A0ACB0ZWQ5_MELEN